MRLFEFFMRGGWLMWPLLILSIASVAIALDRFLALWREPAAADPVLEDLANAASHGAGPARLAAVAAAHAGSAVPVREAELEAVGQEIVAGLEAPLNWLRAIAEVGPLLGFLGTVIGMIAAFDNIVEQGTTNPGVVAAGISTALLTTAGGLLVGIPAYLFHSALSGRLDRVAGALERIAAAMAAEPGGRP